MPDPGLARPLDLGDPDLRRLILRLAVPSVAGLSVSALHHVANIAFVGRLGGEAVAAVSVAVPVFVLVGAVGEGLGVGAAAAIGRHLGARSSGRAGVTASTALALAVAVGVLLTAVLLAALGPVLTLFGATAGTLPLAMDYARPLAWGCALLMAQQVCDFIAIAEGNSRFSMWTLLGGFSLNIALDPLMIFGLGLGVTGAAIATLASQAAVLLVYAAYFARRRGVVRAHPRLVRAKARDVLRPIAAVGLPATLSGALAAAAFALVYAQASAYGGDGAVAGIGVGLRLLTLGLMPLAGFCLGAQAVLSFAWGANDPARVLAAVRFMLKAATAFAALYALPMLLLADPIAAFFAPDPAVAPLAAAACRAFHLVFALAGVQAVLLVLLQSLGKGWAAAVVGLAPFGYLLAAALLVLPPRWGIDGVVASLPAAAALTAALSAALLWREVATLRRLAGRGAASAAGDPPLRLAPAAGSGSAPGRPAP